MMEIVFATNNENKVREIQAVLPGSFRIKRLADIGCTAELPETTGTIEGNSAEKAWYVYNFFGVDCFAEDTGLEVDALGGEPGVDSAFYAGPERDNAKNIAKLLQNLTAEMSRKAHFKTVITLIVKGKEKQFTGILEGEIAVSPKGSGGFGYDPVFLLPDGRSLAELSVAEKGRISHRGKAMAALVSYLRNID